MNFKSIFLVFTVLILIFSVSSVFGENVNVNGTDFEVPHGFSVNKTSDLSAKFVKNNNSNYTIFISVGEDSDSNASISSREVSGFRFIAEENYLSDNNISINQQNYIKNESYYSFYSFKFNDSNYLIGYSFPTVDEFVEGEVNPVTEIIDSL